MNLSESLLNYRDLSILVRADADALGWLEEFLAPSFSRHSNGQRDHGTVVDCVVDKKRYQECQREYRRGTTRTYSCFTMDGRYDSFPGTTASDHALIFLERFKIVLRLQYESVQQRVCHVEILGRDQTARMRLILMKVVRELATSYAIKEFALPLHGAAFVQSKQGVGLIGRKQAGKTTTLINQLLNHDCEYLSNDRFFIFRESSQWIIQGMPTIVKIRHPSLDLFPQLKTNYLRHSYHRERTLKEVHQNSGIASQTEEAVSLSQAQLFEITGVQTATSAILHEIMTPRLNPRVHSSVRNRLSLSNSMQLLKANVLQPSKTEMIPSVFNPNFDNHAYRKALHLRLLQLAQEIPVIELHQNAVTLEQERKAA